VATEPTCSVQGWDGRFYMATRYPRGGTSSWAMDLKIWSAGPVPSRQGPFVRMILTEPSVKTATEVGVRAIQDHKVIGWNTCWKCRLSESTDDM
jgi:hypothetical protein